jgi:hypothetical protein
MSSLLISKDFVAIPSGDSKVGNTLVKVIKLLPTNENSDVVLTTLYIDEPAQLIRKANTTTKENGTYEMEMIYGKYASFGLPDKVIFAFNTKTTNFQKALHSTLKRTSL